MAQTPETIKLELVVRLEYDAKVKYYGTNDPEAMAKIDLDNFKDPGFIMLALEDRDFEVTVRPVKNV